MDLIENLRLYKNQPITHQLLMDSLAEYKRPNDKVYELLKSGVLKAVKRGIYLPGPILGNQQPEPFLLANHILGPSYVSFDAALAYHGLIPERVFEVSSATTKATRKFNTQVGVYSYIHLPLPYYSFGINHVAFGDKQYGMVASPEKALFDKIIGSAGVVLRSAVTAYDYLLESLRMDEERLKELNIDEMESWLPNSPKKESLLMIIKMIKAL
ncbi:type IV toxin-antitoxin system AbiEi family antitoxin domain-containing protein [Pedobacter arcticus]|uniref:type IV toxin-antitoxin system AbiEi family antitoxin domain-containing protein n=1 Tax=Pedobacter arcticus TaxID=752140 RepID=UPI00031E112F|nr:hypothetical protein [Pedobacter arcticus]